MCTTPPALTAAPSPNKPGERIFLPGARSPQGSVWAKVDTRLRVPHY